MTAGNAKPRIIAGGKYELLDVIGEGGMGLVYVGRHVVLDRKIAVKVLHPEFVHRSDATDRFLKEARLVSQLRHQNTVQLLDFGTDGREYWLVMEYLDGEDLASLIADEGKIPPLRALNIAIQLLAALGEAHDTGIVHCDLKPANIMVIPWHDDDGLPTELIKVLDFGIATLAKDSRPSKEVAGTPDYMSPEQAQGLGVEARSDLYAVGVMLHEMLTGRAPFSKSDPVQTMWAQVEEPAPLLRILEPNLPESLEACLQKALTKDMDGRFRHARTFRTRLIEIADEMSGLGRRPTTKDDAVATVATGTTTGVGRARSRAMWLVVGVALMASVGAFALALSNSGSPNTPAVSVPATVAIVTDAPANPALAVPVETNMVAPDVTSPGDDVTIAAADDDASNTAIGLDVDIEADAEDRAAPDVESELADTATIEQPVLAAVTPSDNSNTPSTSPTENKAATAEPRTTPKPHAKDPVATKTSPTVAPSGTEPGPDTTPTPTADPAPTTAVNPTAPDTSPPTPDVAAVKDPIVPETRPPEAKVIPSLAARAGFSELTVKGSLPRSSIQRALDGARAAVEGCYHDGAASAGKDLAATLKVNFEINVDGQLRNVVVQAFGLPGVSACVQANLERQRTRDRPDTGTVSATARLRFNPLPPEVTP